MHPLLQIIITNPGALAKYKNSKVPKDQKVYNLTRKTPQNLLHTLTINYLHHTANIPIPPEDKIPSQLITWATNLDHLYYEIAELYKEATDKVPPITQTLITNLGAPINITHPNLDTKHLPIVIITNPLIKDNILTIDPKTELHITIIHN